MKSTKTPSPLIKKSIEYPCLMEYTNGKFVVLFRANKNGIVVHANQDSMWPLGSSENWTNIDCGDWVPFEGEITLKN